VICRLRRACAGRDSRRHAVHGVPHPGSERSDRATASRAATEHIDAELPVGTKRGDYFEAAWLFIDGRLIGRLPVKRTVTLEWGSHYIKVVIGAYSDERPRYFTVEWPHYVVNRGATTTLSVGPAIERATNGEPLPGDMRHVPSPEPRMIDEWRRFAAADLANVQKALEEVREKPAGQTRVRIAVNDRIGGAREFDADQLRFLNRVLRYAGEAPAEEVDRTLRQLIALLSR
jgi:hypothetical protein